MIKYNLSLNHYFVQAQKLIGSISPQDITPSKSLIVKVVEVFRVLFNKAVEMEHVLKKSSYYTNSERLDTKD